jgi:hypothetical protein
MINNRALRALAASVRPVASRSFATIPINQVARVYKTNVKDEATAVKMDALLEQ